MPFSCYVLLTIIVLLNLAFLSIAWVPPSHVCHRKTTLYSTVDKEGNTRYESRPDEMDVKHTIESLEAALGANFRVNEDAEASFCVLTSAGRHRRRLEMDLLRQLDSDYVDNRAVDELMHLWMFEHDAESGLQLEAMQESCSPGMVVEEKQLLAMCQRFPTWAEPRARLSILYFVKGSSAKAYDMALEALALKPWHFEVFHVLVMICLRHENMRQALYWARRGLPNVRPNSVGNKQRRKAWVNLALTKAAELWELAERQTLDQERRQGALNGACTSDAGDAWQ